MDMSFAKAALLALALLAGTTAWHHRALQFLGRLSTGRDASRFGVVALLVAIVSVHIAQISLYALGYALAADVLGLGGLIGPDEGSPIGYFYFAAQTYSTLGYGDIVPVGAVRLLASVESLNGLMLIAWSGAFLYGVLDGPGFRSGKPPEERR